jgi:hypothetical protein
MSASLGKTGSSRPTVQTALLTQSGYSQFGRGVLVRNFPYNRLPFLGAPFAFDHRSVPVLRTVLQMRLMSDRDNSSNVSNRSIPWPGRVSSENQNNRPTNTSDTEGKSR